MNGRAWAMHAITCLGRGDVPSHEQALVPPLTLTLSSRERGLFAHPYLPHQEGRNKMDGNCVYLYDGLAVGSSDSRQTSSLKLALKML